MFFITPQQFVYFLLLSPYFLEVDGGGGGYLFDVQKFLELTAVVFTDYVISATNEFTFHKNTGNGPTPSLLHHVGLDGHTLGVTGYVHFLVILSLQLPRF